MEERVAAMAQNFGKLTSGPQNLAAQSSSIAEKLAQEQNAKKEAARKQMDYVANQYGSANEGNDGTKNMN